MDREIINLEEVEIEVEAEEDISNMIILKAEIKVDHIEEIEEVAVEVEEEAIEVEIVVKMVIEDVVAVEEEAVKRDSIEKESL